MISLVVRFFGIPSESTQLAYMANGDIAHLLLEWGTDVNARGESAEMPS
jgi:hypothetical protein